MDSLTQMTLGAAVGAAVMGRSHGRKAALIGAICGTVPDLDVFIPFGDPVSNFTYHRGFSHSLLFSIIFTPILVLAFSKIKYFNIQIRDKSPYIAIFLCLWTHCLLDAMTIYGTQLWWPLPVPPVGVGSMFIIDPLYSLPLLFCLLLYLATKWRRAVMIGLCLGTAYLGWSMVAQNHVHNIAKSQIESEQILVQPTPFNTILWRVLVMQGDEYQVGYYSLFDDTTEIEWQSFKSDTSQLPNNWAVSRLQWFTKGFYGVRTEGDDVVMSDLRMGLEPTDYVFQFIVNRVPNEQFSVDRNMGRLSQIWDRMVRDL